MPSDKVTTVDEASAVINAWKKADADSFVETAEEAINVAVGEDIDIHDDGWPWMVYCHDHQDATDEEQEAEQRARVEAAGDAVHVARVHYLGWSVGLCAHTLCGVDLGPIDPALVARNVDVYDGIADMDAQSGNGRPCDCDGCNDVLAEIREIIVDIAGENERARQGRMVAAGMRSQDAWEQGSLSL